MLSANPFALLIMTLPIIALFAGSCIRRCRDAGITNYWQFLPSAVFGIAALLIAFTDHNGFIFTLILPLILILILLTYKSQDSQLTYQYGYNGPIDLTASQASYQQASVRRVEPTLVGSAGASSIDASMVGTHDINEQTAQVHMNQNTDKATEQDIGEKIRMLVLAHKVKIAIALAVLFLLVVIIAAFSGSEQTVVEEPQIAEQSTNLDEFSTLSNTVTLVDGFSISSNPYQGIVISWQADETLRKELWRFSTAEGDETCQQLTFNNKKSIRTAKVFVENDANYFAVFSPLDRNELINQLAKRGSFKLCGYDFSLKGSQAALGKVRYYGEILSY